MEVGFSAGLHKSKKLEDLRPESFAKAMSLTPGLCHSTLSGKEKLALMVRGVSLQPNAQ